MTGQDSDSAPIEVLPLGPWTQPPKASAILPDVPMDEQEGDTASAEDPPLVSSPPHLETPGP